MNLAYRKEGRSNRLSIQAIFLSLGHKEMIKHIGSGLQQKHKQNTVKDGVCSCDTLLKKFFFSFFCGRIYIT